MQFGVADCVPTPRSLTDMFGGAFPQVLQVVHRRRAEEPLVLAGEVRDVAAPDAVSSACGVETLAEHSEVPSYAGGIEPSCLFSAIGVVSRCPRCPRRKNASGSRQGIKHATISTSGMAPAKIPNDGRLPHTASAISTATPPAARRQSSHPTHCLSRFRIRPPYDTRATGRCVSSVREARQAINAVAIRLITTPIANTAMRYRA